MLTVLAAAPVPFLIGTGLLLLVSCFHRAPQAPARSVSPDPEPNRLGRPGTADAHDSDATGHSWDPRAHPDALRRLLQDGS